MTDIIQFSRRGFMALPVVAVAACQKADEPVEMSGATMGTTYNIVAMDPSGQVNKTELKQAVEAVFAKVNAEILAGGTKADILISSDRFWYEEMAQAKRLEPYQTDRGLLLFA